MSDLAKQQFDKWLHEIVAESTDGQTIQRRDCMTADQDCMVFEAWQASRECLVIELPKPYAWDNDGGFDRESDHDSECSMALIPTIDVMQSIHAAGVKTI